MEDNNLNKKTGNLEDKLKNSYDIKDVKKKDTKTQLIIGVFVVIVLMIIFFVARSLGGNKNQIKNDQTKTQDSVKQESNLNGNKNVTKVDEDGKEKQYKIQELSEDKKNKDENIINDKNSKGTGGLVKRGSKQRPEIIQKGMQDKIKSYVEEDVYTQNQVDSVLNTEQEFALFDQDIVQARNEYYENNTGIKSELNSVFLSAEEGFTDDQAEYGSNNFTAIVKERAENFITHEIEKRINPSYMGSDKVDKIYDIKDIYINNYAKPTSNEFTLNYYTVNYYAVNPKDENDKIENSFTFFVDMGGNIIWEKE